MLDAGADQASGLRSQPPAAELSLMAFPLVPGAGTSWIARLSQTLRSLGARPIVIDGGRGALLTRSFGLKPRHDLLDLLRGRVDFDEAAQCTPDGVYVLRAERGIDAFVSSGAAPGELFGAFARLSQNFDALLLAMPPSEIACLAPPLNAVPVIALDTGEDGVVNTYTTIKQLAEGFGYSRFALVTHGPGAAHQQAAHERIAHAARIYLNADVALAGWMPEEGTRLPSHMVHVAGNLLAGAATPVLLH